MMKQNKKKEKKESEVVLALFINARGFGYCLIDQIEKPIDYGMIKPKNKSMKEFRQRFQYLIDLYEPQIVILEDSENAKTKSKRIKKLIALFKSEAEQKELTIYTYSRQQIREVFASFQALTKFEISKVIARWIPQLEMMVPNKRRAWEPEAYQMGIFDAFSLVMTHFYSES